MGQAKAGKSSKDRTKKEAAKVTYWVTLAAAGGDDQLRVMKAAEAEMAVET